MDEEQLSRRSLLALLGGAGAAIFGRGGDALAAALSGESAEAKALGAAARHIETEGGAAAEDAGAVDATASGALPLAQPVLDAGPGQPRIIARRAWARHDSPPAYPPEYGTVQIAFVHHTDTPNGYSPSEVPELIRSIYVYHRFSNGWNDIGYNFVVDRFGRIFEARAGGIDEPVIGAQAGGYNGFSTGIALLGDYEAARISSAAREALQRLIAWKLSLHGAPVLGELTVKCEVGGSQYSRFPARSAVTLSRVSGHRQADATSCPGDALYGQLREVRRLAAKLAGTPAVLTLGLEGEQRGSEGAPAQRTLSGSLSFLGGGAIPEAAIEIQVRDDSARGEDVEERTVASTTTDAGGAFAVTLPVLPDPRRTPSSKREGRGTKDEVDEAAVSLRALCLGSETVPAAVSAPLELAAKLLLPAA
jgi:hypothetical protein